MIDRKSLLLMGKALANPEYKRAFIIAIMNDEDYEELRNLYIKLDKKDKKRRLKIIFAQIFMIQREKEENLHLKQKSYFKV